MSNDKLRIAIVEDNIEHLDLLAEFFRQRGHVVRGFCTGEDFLYNLKSTVFDYVLLDLGLPGVGGKEVLSRIKKDGFTGHVFLVTGETDESVAVKGLSLGAADFIRKPFSVTELALKIENHAKMVVASPAPTVDFHPVTFPEPALDKKNLTFSLDNVSVDLREAEFKILNALLKSTNSTVSRNSLFKLLGLSADSRSLDVHISRIRKKMDAFDGSSVKTLHGKGYQLVVEKESVVDS